MGLYHLLIFIGLTALVACTPPASPRPSKPTLNDPIPSANQIELSWQSVPGTLSYSLERGEGQEPSSWLAVALPSPTATKVVDGAGIQAATTYTYRVQAISAAGSSDFDTASATTLPLPPAPTNFRAVRSTATSLELSWDKLEGSSYGLERGIGANPASYQKIPLRADSPPFEDTGLAAGTDYTYRLTVNAASGANSVNLTATTLPLPVSGLNATAISGAGVRLTWVAVFGATTYSVERGVGASPSSWLEVASLPTATSTYTLSGLPLGSNTFRVRASNASGYGAYSNQASLNITEAVPPPNPANFRSTNFTNALVDLAWDPVPLAASYVLERRVGTAAYVSLGSLTSATISYTDRTVAASTTYTYRLRSVHSGGSSTGAEVRVTTAANPPPIPANPTGFTATPSSASTRSVRLGWTAVSGALSYSLERGEGASPTAWVNLSPSTPLSTPSFTDNTANPGTQYTYRLRSSNTTGSSSGVTATATTPRFIRELVATGLQDIPWSINFAPDGRLLFTPRNKTSLQVRALSLPATPAIPTALMTPLTLANVTVYTSLPNVAARHDSTEPGIMGMELDPSFATNRYVYICYSRLEGSTRTNRLSRFVLGTHLTNETIYLDMPGGTIHQGCRVIHHGGYLYVSMGESGFPNEVQKTNVGYGRVFRLNLSGGIPNNNPFYSTSTANVGRATWTLGHRNPQGLAIQPGTNALWSTEHGPQTRDELNVLVAGKNYGWPNCVGIQAFNQSLSAGSDGTYPCGTSGVPATLTASNYQPAVREYEGGNSPTIAPSDLVFYPLSATAFPAWQGNLLFVTLKTQRLYRLTLSDQTITSQELLINGGLGRLRDVTVGPDGFIYISTDGLTTAGGGDIYRLRP